MSETIRSWLDAARRQLAGGLPEPEARFEAALLMTEALGVNRAWLISHAEQALTTEQLTDFQALLQRRLQGEPVAYILGKREFYGMALSITPDVLIPRPDTETLVDAALAYIPAGQPCRVLDLGTGSGAIAIALATHRALSTVTAVDASQSALAVAQRNAEQSDARNVHCILSDWFSALPGEVFDVIVSNPPYIAAGDPHLEQGDLRFEPAGALASGPDGLDAIRHIVAMAPRHLADRGWLLLEHGHDQAAAVAALMGAHGFEDIGHAADLAGIQRVTLGRRPARSGLDGILRRKR
ncbi:MAG: peptide chain release factor N(5)-glutamine methyltransferase [Methylobacterium sp.]|nr:peptide chain release factor N(5)-glutamine methyltransferase [Methylobacterium sp.]